MADFTPEEVIQVVLDGRKCRGADLRNINLSGADLSGAVYGGSYFYGGGDYDDFNTFTKWPEGFDPEAAGAVLAAERS